MRLPPRSGRRSRRNRRRRRRSLTRPLPAGRSSPKADGLLQGRSSRSRASSTPARRPCWINSRARARANSPKGSAAGATGAAVGRGSSCRLSSWRRSTPTRTASSPTPSSPRVLSVGLVRGTPTRAVCSPPNNSVSASPKRCRRTGPPHRSPRGQLPALSQLQDAAPRRNRRPGPAFMAAVDVVPRADRELLDRGATVEASQAASLTAVSPGQRLFMIAFQLDPRRFGGVQYDLSAPKRRVCLDHRPQRLGHLPHKPRHIQSHKPAAFAKWTGNRFVRLITPRGLERR